MVLWGVSIVCLIPLLSIDLSFIQSGAAAYIRQHKWVDHVQQLLPNLCTIGSSVVCSCLFFF